MDLRQAHHAFGSVEHYLDPRTWGDAGRLEAVSAALQAGRLVIVRNAFRAHFAEQVLACLESAGNWLLRDSYEDGSLTQKDVREFNYRHHNIFEPAADQVPLMLCREVFRSPASGEFFGRLAGVTCRAPAKVMASWYQPGDHSCPHGDELRDGDVVRRIAFVWYLARDWQPHWGGALYWGPAERYLAPVFNSLALFKVGPHHCVTPVSPHANSKRLSVNGWFRDIEEGPPAAASDVEAAPAVAPLVETV